MKVLAASLGIMALAATLGLVAAQDRPARAPEPARTDQTKVSTERPADVSAVSDLLAAFVKAYNSKDAKAIGELFTPDAEIEDDDGEITRGRVAIVERFMKIFEKGAGGTLEVAANSLRFLGTDIAVEEGTASLATGAGTPPVTNQYSVIYARQGGRWLHARIRDEPPEDDPHERLLDLEWMLGEWVNESDDAIVQTTCTWSKDGNFLLREFDVKIEGRSALRGTQRIGWDAQRKQFRAWVFDDRGGFAEGLMARDDDRWVIKAMGVRSDGKAVSVTNAITILGKDRVLWESYDRTLGGEAISGTDRYTLVRRPPNPGK